MAAMLHFTYNELLFGHTDMPGIPVKPYGIDNKIMNPLQLIEKWH